MPTPIPENYDPSKPVNGAYVASAVKAATDKPQFLHFFNPACPCSKFNIPHFKAFVKKYSEHIDFSIVVRSADANYTSQQISEKFDLDIPVFFRKDIADSCGVYSTPQAIILDSHQQLYYRGNYNRSRFCTDKNTNFAQMAVDSLLSNSSLTIEKAATKSYG